MTTKQLCCNCKFCKTKTYYNYKGRAFGTHNYCAWARKLGAEWGVNTLRETPHPKCPYDPKNREKLIRSNCTGQI